MSDEYNLEEAASIKLSVVLFNLIAVQKFHLNERWFQCLLKSFTQVVPMPTEII